MKTHVPERNVVFSDSVLLKKGFSKFTILAMVEKLKVHCISLLLILFCFFSLRKFKIYPKGTEPSQTGMDEIM